MAAAQKEAARLREEAKAAEARMQGQPPGNTAPGQQPAGQAPPQNPPAANPPASGHPQPGPVQPGASQPADSPAATPPPVSPPVTPPSAPLAPAAAAPPGPAPPALPAPAPAAQPAPPPAAPDYKAQVEETARLLAAELERKAGQSESWRNMRSHLQHETQVRQGLEREVAALRAAQTPAAPIPANGGVPAASQYAGPSFQIPNAQLGAPPANGAVPAPPPPEMMQRVREGLEKEWGKEAVANNEALVRQIAGEVAHQAAQSAVAQMHQQYGPALNNLSESVNSAMVNQAVAENLQFEQAISEKHADWRQIIGNPAAGIPPDQEFVDWLMAHPTGHLWYAAVLPDQNQSGFAGTAGEHIFILNQYKESLPGYAAGQAQNVEMQSRQEAAAAASQGELHALPPGTPSDQNYVFLSEVMRKHGELSNKPAELLAYTREVDQARLEGRFYDDISRPVFAGPVVQ